MSVRPRRYTRRALRCRPPAAPSAGDRHRVELAVRPDRSVPRSAAVVLQSACRTRRASPKARCRSPAVEQQAFGLPSHVPRARRFSPPALVAASATTSRRSRASPTSRASPPFARVSGRRRRSAAALPRPPFGSGRPSSRGPAVGTLTARLEALASGRASRRGLRRAAAASSIGWSCADAVRPPRGRGPCRSAREDGPSHRCSASARRGLRAERMPGRLASRRRWGVAVGRSMAQGTSCIAAEFRRVAGANLTAP